MAYIIDVVGWHATRPQWGSIRGQFNDVMPVSGIGLHLGL